PAVRGRAGDAQDRADLTVSRQPGAVLRRQNALAEPALKPERDDEPHSYDAVLVVSFGGPEGPADVGPFLDRVFRGLPVSPETKARVAARYERFGGVSPINAATRAFIDAL